METETYSHHGALVSVNSQLKGRHREHCLCFACANFTPDNRDTNCDRANLLYALCVAFEMTTPVYECPVFEAKS